MANETKCDICGKAFDLENVQVPQWTFESEDPAVIVNIMPTEAVLCESCTVAVGLEAMEAWQDDISHD